MTRAPRVAVTALALTVATATVAGARTTTERRAGATTTNTVASVAGTGDILGVVTNRAGGTLGEVLVSATGPSGTMLTVCDAEGRFEFRSLQPGRYLVRTHASGFVASRRYVDVVAEVAAVRSLSLPLEPEPAPARTARRVRLAGAGFGGAAAASASPSLAGLPNELPPLETQEDRALVSEADGDADQPSDQILAPHDHGPKAWRLRRARRSVLKDKTGHSGVANADASDSDDSEVAASNDGHIAGLLDGFPVSGQVQLLARTTFDGPGRWWSPDGMPGQVAHVSLAPGRDDDAVWAVRGAVDMTTGTASSWAVSGWYTADPHEDHAVELSLSYSSQLHAAAAMPALSGADDIDRLSRDVGSVQAFDTWSVSPRVTVGYGGTYASYGYLENGKLFSPRAHVTIAPLRHTRVRVALARTMTAPGAEEFLPPVSGVWLPPERTFTSLSRFEPLQAERARHVEIAVERDLGAASVLSVRRFHQDVSNQLITMFGIVGRAPRDAFAAPGGHYYLTSASGVATDGWGVTFSHRVAGRVRGAVGYSLVRAAWLPWTASGLSPGTVGAFRTGLERFHDVTTSVETEIPETSTRVFAICRVNTAFARASTGTVSSGVDARFDVRVTQTLPFSPIDGSTWELLVAIRSLFHDEAFGTSAYDELLVVDPPQQFVGGLVVHF